MKDGLQARLEEILKNGDEFEGNASEENASEENASEENASEDYYEEDYYEQYPEEYEQKSVWHVVEDIAFTIMVALVLPIVLPILLHAYSALFKTEFAEVMNEVGKAWVLITQAVTIFFGLKNKTVAYIIMLAVIAGIFVIEGLICLLLMIPIW